MQFRKFSTTKIYVSMHGKQLSLFSNGREKVLKSVTTRGQICLIGFLLFWTFSLRLENKGTLKCSSDSFPHMVTYMLGGGNCQKYILMHCCLPIVGRLSLNVLKYHVTRISEYNLTKLLTIFCQSKWQDNLIGNDKNIYPGKFMPMT